MVVDDNVLIFVIALMLVVNAINLNEVAKDYSIIDESLLSFVDYDNALLMLNFQNKEFEVGFMKAMKDIFAYDNFTHELQRCFF